jgi:hypothetical protein
VACPHGILVGTSTKTTVHENHGARKPRCSHHRVACRRGMVSSASDASQPPLRADKLPMVASQSNARDLITAIAGRRQAAS